MGKWFNGAQRWAKGTWRDQRGSMELETANRKGRVMVEEDGTGVDRPVSIDVAERFEALQQEMDLLKVEIEQTHVGLQEFMMTDLSDVYKANARLGTDVGVNVQRKLELIPPAGATATLTRTSPVEVATIKHLEKGRGRGSATRGGAVRVAA